MDFRGRSNQNAPAQSTQQTVNRAPSAQSSSVNQFADLAKKPNKLIKYSAVVLLFAVTALVIALTFLLAFGGTSAQKLIQKDKYQAVFLNNGQVYFGHITSISDKNYDLQGIYYLQTNGGSSAAADTQSNTSATNVSLVKLGCELHAPYDQMLINADQVLFWENLQDKGQVVQAINKYKADNKTQTCSTASQNSTQQAPSTSSTQSSTGNTSTTNTSTATGTTKKQ